MKHLLPFICAFLSACNTYSKIDSKHWDHITHSYHQWQISYDLPAGYQDRAPWITTTGHEVIAAHNYDVLTGPQIYGTPLGESIFIISVRHERPVSPEAFLQEQLDSDARDRCSLTSSQPWWVVACENDNPDWPVLTNFILVKLNDENYLNVAININRAAFRRKSVRESRIRMFNDIVNTLRVSEMPTSGSP